MQKIESFLPAIFELRVGSGRRTGKFRTLQHKQLLLDEGRCGNSVWEADQKGGVGNVVEIPVHTGQAVDEHLNRMRDFLGARIGEEYLFPGARDVNQPISQNCINRWLREAEKLAEVETPRRLTLARLPPSMGYRPQAPPRPRRRETGGWVGPQTLEQVYQRADEDGVSRVVREPAEVRKVYGKD